MEAITLDAGDTGTVAEGVGAVGSRPTAIGGSALVEGLRQGQGDGRGRRAPARHRRKQFEVAGQAWGFGAYAALVEIGRRDRDTPPDPGAWP